MGSNAVKGPRSDTERQTVWVRSSQVNSSAEEMTAEGICFVYERHCVVIYDPHIREKLMQKRKIIKIMVSFILSSANRHHLCLLLIIKA